MYSPSSDVGVTVQLQDVAYSGAEGSVVSVCVDGGPADRTFNVTLATSPDMAVAG